MDKMFCYQCEQTAGCSGCKGNSGVCGKSAEVAKLQDELTGAMIGLAKACENNAYEKETIDVLVEGLFATITNVNFNEETIKNLIDQVHRQKDLVVPNCASCVSRCGNTDDYEMSLLWNAQEDIRSLKSLILFGIRGVAAYAYHARVLGYRENEVDAFFVKALAVIGYDFDMEELLPIVLEVGEINYKCMELLDKANTETYGNPIPVKVPLTIEKGINIYTHGEMLHIEADKDGKKDFTLVIEKALALGGYAEDRVMTGMNGGTEVMTGFAHETVLGVADQVVEAVKAGKISHFFLVGGCDGARTGHNYYTEFVKETPEDSIILTLACGKYRFHDLQLGEIEGLPRIMDMGQCNDAYSAIRVAVALAEAFQCDVNELPLSIVLSWYEQKAVCVLLTLLHLGIKNIYLGPTLPAFVSPNVLSFLVENYNLTPTGNAKEDLAKML